MRVTRLRSSVGIDSRTATLSSPGAMVAACAREQAPSSPLARTAIGRGAGAASERTTTAEILSACSSGAGRPQAGAAHRPARAAR